MVAPATEMLLVYQAYVILPGPSASALKLALFPVVTMVLVSVRVKTGGLFG